jgi:hypothetical protein
VVDSIIQNKHDDMPAVRRFPDMDVASRYFEKSISGIRNVESDLTSYDG